jgi:hypothetical protein
VIRRRRPPGSGIAEKSALAWTPQPTRSDQLLMKRPPRQRERQSLGHDLVTEQFRAGLHWRCGPGAGGSDGDRSGQGTRGRWRRRLLEPGRSRPFARSGVRSRVIRRLTRGSSVGSTARPTTTRTRQSLKQLPLAPSSPAAQRTPRLIPGYALLALIRYPTTVANGIKFGSNQG